MTGRICEIFESIQGEGLYQGERHIFVRLSGCNLSCSFCDTDFLTNTELTVAEVLTEINKYPQVAVVSVTGGEPLLQIDFLKKLVPEMKKIGKTIYLETNGTLYDELLEIVGWLDIIAMDFKLPSTTKCQPLWEQHSNFLRLAVNAKAEVFIKIVVGPETINEEINRAIEIITGIDPKINVIIQPQHPHEDSLKAKVTEISNILSNAGMNFYVKDQLHKKIGVR